MQTSQATIYISDKARAKAISFIRAAEDVKLKAYPDSGGVLTIGYGHVIHDVDILPPSSPLNCAAMPDRFLQTAAGQRMAANLVITPAIAEYLLQTDLALAAGAVGELSKTVHLNSNQQAALIALVFNIGVSAFNGSTLIKKIKLNRPIAEIEHEFLRWRFDNGKENAGLLSRRKAEFTLYVCARDL
ncbi:lysozyme [Iodobacter fluviatilis]|uniref:Lysozyme n=2 Tax=Iodobacter fluviatilis TaxID=537 RepID=A0A377Q8I8_9NEIS|nr:lysozyme [Iodobacter fluviatilis]STQ91202.1 Phage-related lysozyme (muraminidase) [Iodobacter fluviatilis]